jgi:hypothetical protein
MLRAALVLVAVTACSPGIYRAPVREPNYYSINPDGSRSERYSRINQWASYGTNALGAQTKIAAAYEDAQHAPPPPVPVEVYNASFPPGVTLEDGTVRIAKDAPYEAIGRFEIGYWTQTAPREHEIEADLRRLASVTQGTTIVVEVQRVGHADDRVQYINGIVLRTRTAKPTASTPRPRVHARLVYQPSGEGVLSEDAFADEVSAKLGYSPWQASAETTLRTEIRCRPGNYHATISLPGAPPKQLSGATCKHVTDAVVTVIVVQLDASTKP